MMTVIEGKMDLSGKTILVTGGAVRIGRRLCERLADAGGRVVIHCHRSEAQAETLARQVRERGGGAWVVRRDLSDEAGCDAVIRESIERAGALDGLVNNASVFNRNPLDETDETVLLRDLRPNLFAPLFLMRAFIRQAVQGRIVNVLDRRIATLEKGMLAYQLSKRALADLTRLAAVELAPRFTVNGVAPGPVLPPVGDGEKMPDKAGRILTAHRPTPDEVADAVIYLLTADSVTGQILYVDGGQHLNGG